MSRDPRIGEVAAELAYPRPIGAYDDERAERILMRADQADKAAGIYRVSLDAAVEAAAEKFCDTYQPAGTWSELADTARKGYREYFREVLTAAVTGGAQ